MCTGTNLITLNEKFYKKYVIPALFMCDPEKSHSILIFAGKYGFIPKSLYKDPPILVSVHYYYIYIYIY